MKKRHWLWLAAWWHCRRVNARYGNVYNVYRCRWHDDYRRGENAFPHWHVGTNDRYGLRTRS